MSITVMGLQKSFGAYQALKNITLTIETGQLFGLLGPSGSGKTTLLRIIAGLEKQDSGDVIFDGLDTHNLKAADRRVGFVFQHYALFPRMTAFENIAFGLRVRPRETRPTNVEITRRVTELLKLVQLQPFGDRYPAQLSGGQRQRVALARALAVEPKVLLLDEPFGALDAMVRQELRTWLRRLHDEIRMTTVFVTHDQEEALEVSDRVVIMSQGRIEQIGSPEEIYSRPATPFVHGFLGEVNVFNGRRVDSGDLTLESVAEALLSDAPGPAATTEFYIRPHLLDLTLSPHPQSKVKAKIQHINAAGPLVRVELGSYDDRKGILVALSQDRYKELKLKKGDEVFVMPKGHFQGLPA